MDYEKLSKALEALKHAEEQVVINKRVVDSFLKQSAMPTKVVLRKKRKKLAKKGGWTYYKRQKMAKHLKRRWDSMTPEQRTEYKNKMLAGRLEAARAKKV